MTIGQDVDIQVHEKDFRSKALIKEAILENDFLKNLSQSQVLIVAIYNFSKNVFDHNRDEPNIRKLQNLAPFHRVTHRDSAMGVICPPHRGGDKPTWEEIRT